MQNSIRFTAILILTASQMAFGLTVTNATHEAAREGTVASVSGSFDFSGDESFAVVYSLPEEWGDVDGSGTASSGTATYAFNAEGNELSVFFFSPPVSPLTFEYEIDLPSVQAAGTVTAEIQYNDANGSLQPPIALTPDLAFQAPADVHWAWDGGDPSSPVWTVYLTRATLEGANLDAGDEVSLFDGDTLVGWYRLEQPLDGTQVADVKITAFSGLADESTGYSAGNQYTFKCWDASENREYGGGDVSFADTGDPDAYEGDAFPEGDAAFSALGLTFAGADDVSILTSTTAVNVPEGGTADFQVKLSAQPPDDVVVTVSRAAGDEDIVIDAGASLTFTTANWDQYQTVSLAAAEDNDDAANGEATIRCSAQGLDTVEVTATEQDDEYTLSITGENGSVIVVPDQTYYDSGTTVALTPQPNGGFEFDGWAGDAGGEESPLQVVVDQDIAITALFAAIHEETGWTATVNFEGGHETTLEFGMNETATDDWDDGTDVDNTIPAPGVAGAYLYQRDLSYKRDMRAIKAEDEWLLAVQTNDQESIEFSWSLPGEFPTNKFLSMYEVFLDLETMERTPVGATARNMALATDYIVPADATRYFVIKYASDLTADLAFLPGWNLVSLPIEPHDPAIDAILDEGIRTRGEFNLLRDGLRGVVYTGSIWRWDARSYKSANELHALNGYWIFADAATSFLVRGAPPETSTLDLDTGWNLIGSPRTMPVPQHERVRGRCWKWMADEQLYQPVDTIRPGVGYWLNAQAPVTLPIAR